MARRDVSVNAPPAVRIPVGTRSQEEVKVKAISRFCNYTMGPAAAVALVISFFGLIATVFYVRIQQREGV